MADSLKDQLEGNLECENILQCLYGLKELDKKCYTLLLNSDEAMSATEISDAVSRDESTVHRSLNKLRDNELIYREKRSLESRGYEYIYESNEPKEVSENMIKMIDQWNSMIKSLVNEFENKYN